MQLNRSQLISHFVVCLVSLLLVFPAEAQWTLYEETSIVGSVRGSIRKGHIFKTRSGHIYEVMDYVYLYEYEYSPGVVVLSDGSLYKLVIEGFDEPLLSKCLNCSQEANPSTPAFSRSQRPIIKIIQAALASLGFDPGDSDGNFGPQTRSAVTKFRAESGLARTDSSTATGSLDVLTLRAIAVSLVEKFPEKNEAVTTAISILKASQNWPPAHRGQTTPLLPSSTPKVVESYITSDFDGLDHGNIYKLANGQIWEQTEYWIWVWVWVDPQVLIWNDGGTYRMKVEGIERPVMVRRIK